MFCHWKYITVLLSLLPLNQVLGSSGADRVIGLTDFNRCSWIVDMSTTKNPTKVWDTYFNEKGSYDIKEELQETNITKFLQPVTKGDSQGYYVFPYFVLVRATCDSGNYDDSYYRLLLHGTYPTIVISYAPKTNRDPIRYTWRTFSTGGLINVDAPDKDNIQVPPNPNAPNCYLSMCYPAFVVPLVFLQIPIFEVKVEAMDVFSKATTRFHVTPYNSRKGERDNGVELGTILTEVGQFFPDDRINQTANPELLTDSILRDLEDDDHFPLDKEDFFDPQYTYGSAPVVIFSGFYQSNLIIMADPDLNTIRTVRWERNPLTDVGKSDENYTIFDHALTCRWLDKKYYNDDLLDIPIYSSGEGEFSNEWTGTNYRKRVQPMFYQNESVPNAIFEAIAMEDRLLLVTYSGLVVLYGTSNMTVYTDTALKAPTTEKLRKCFKFVRVGRHASQDIDLVVAATYHYMEQQSFTDDEGRITQTNEEIDQEIWMGKLTASGKPLSWVKLGETENMDSLRTATNEGKMSQVGQICHDVKNMHMRLDENNTLYSGYCWVIDGTPAAGQTETIQLLIEMKIRHLPTLAYFKDEELGLMEEESELTFYIIAQHTPLKSYSKQQIWEIVAVIPRRPCVDAHRQKIQTIERFGSQYFNREKAAPTDDPEEEAEENLEFFKKNCHYANRDKLFNDLYLSRMTYTRQNNGHLFLYGNRLIHSTSGGQAFAYLKGFPSKNEMERLRSQNNQFLEHDIDDVERRRLFNKVTKDCRNHVIKVMAFSNGGHFAFLTSKRHLYLGSMGTVDVIRLRPSPGYSMIRTTISLNPGLHDGRPFSVLYDSNDQLFEMVVTVTSNRTIKDIRRRPIPWSLIIQNTKFVQKLNASMQNVANDLEDSKPTSEIGEDEAHDVDDEANDDDDAPGPQRMENIFKSKHEDDELKIYCPFGDPAFFQNYSATMSRQEDFIIRPPSQHTSLGLPLRSTSLLAFQASSYSLVHNMFLYPKEETYSHDGDTNIFERWVSATAEEAQLGFFRYFTGDPILYGIVVNPKNFKQLPQDDDTAGRLIPDRLYLDYNQVIMIKLQFSISTTDSLDKTDYRKQKLSLLQLTIDNGNGSILEVETERVVDAKRASVEFFILLSLNQKTAKLKQHLPGELPTVVPLSLHFIGGFGYCFPNAADTYIGDHTSTAVYAGCRPATQLQFNWNSTLRSMRFRSPSHWMGQSTDCYNDEVVCFYKELPLVLHFDVYDSAKQTYIPYTGKYKLRVVAGGYSPDKLEPYTEEQQEAYNIPGKSDVSLIWFEWNVTASSKVKTKILTDANEEQTKEVTLEAGKSVVKWACHTLSPCARVWPTWHGQAIFYFKLRITNRDVDDSTLCLHERDFIIHLYGFTPSSEIQLLISVVFCIFIVLLLHLMYFCCRNQRKVWRANKVKMYGWMQIIIDTFPKAKSGVDLNSDLTQQLRRDEILMSLQGHLRVPVISDPTSFNMVDQQPNLQRAPSPPPPPSKLKSTTVRRTSRDVDTTSSRSSSTSSRSSVNDDEDGVERTESTLPTINPRHAPATWTDMIYDQIITKRLHAIIQRNNEMKENILKKVDYSQGPDGELIGTKKEDDSKPSQKDMSA